ncbi:hypothetical protein PG993_002943 [Apiospora rasikravindrae]|uniref:Developmental regulator protein n=1 Tax=Apiospora rasikravindrae TaxID=990691 RepID=A0ABR1U0R3_9PEZI
MPTYLCHGFRWHRKSIRYFVVIQDLDDAAPEWIVAPQSAVAFLYRFYDLFDFLPPSNPPRSKGSSSDHNYKLSNSSRKHSRPPPPSAHQNNHRRFETNERDETRVGRARETWSDRIRDSASRSRSRSRTRKCGRNNVTASRASTPEPDATFNDWAAVKLLEEYDPANVTRLNGPWAYVADHIVRVDTSLSIADEMAKYEERMKSEKVKAMTGPSDETGRKLNSSGNKKPGWFEMLRDNLQRGEEIKWYVVVCGDEERSLSVKDVDESYGPVRGRGEYSSKNPPPPFEFDEEEFICRFPELLGKGGDAPRNKDWRRPKATDPGPLIAGENSASISMPEFSDFEVRPLSLRPPPARKTPPVVPTKDHPRRAPPIPTALQMQETRKVPIDDASRPKTPRTGSNGGLRRFFSKRNLQSTGPD